MTNTDELKDACPEIYRVIRMNLRNFVMENQDDITADELTDTIIEETYNRDETFTNTDSYDPTVLCVESMFEIVKIVSKISREEYGMTFNVDTIEKTIDLFAYLCAKEIGYELIDMFNLHNNEREI